MATILLQAAGAALGAAFGPIGIAVGRAAGALAGNLVDHAVLNAMTTVEANRLDTARLAGGQEGTPITRLYGTARIAGTMVWATRFEEQISSERSGGKATGPAVETASYSANFAVVLSEGPVTAIRRVWADGRELDLTQIEMRFHRGLAGQAPDPLIEAKQGVGNTPAYRGVAMLVFEGLPLADYGNRIPAIECEVIRSVGTLEHRIRAVTLIPGATEHGYDPETVTETIEEGEERIINRNQWRKPTDLVAAIDELVALCPNLVHVAIVSAWFGDDLRAGSCRILPGVETRARQESRPWRVSSLDRTNAKLISAPAGSPAYGGTPNDESLVRAIRHLKALNLKVTLYPFLMMDIPPGNTLDDPGGGTGQPVYPWRGRIRVTGDEDGSAAATTAIADFLGSAMPGDFTLVADGAAYAGHSTGYRRFVLHHAALAKAAGGVDAFLIGSELVGLTQSRGPAHTYPFVDGLVALAGDCRAFLGSKTKITYGADWSEYFGHHPEDQPGDVIFHLDPLWASPDISAIGVDNYMPLGDWRDEDHRAPHPDGAQLADDRKAMALAVGSGEGFDHYYASAADRDARIRSPITDEAHGEPWIWRFKDIEGWWSNLHFNRIDGKRSVTPTAWVPGMKPVWFTEAGCPAVDRGGNQPNVFIDPKSSESKPPHFSAGRRSDATQRRFLEAFLDGWSVPQTPAGMVDPDRIYLWTWDARPFPAFPEDTGLYADGANWHTGHWLNGRLGAGTLADCLAALLADHDYTRFDVSRVSGDLPGYMLSRPMSLREAMEPLLLAGSLDAVHSGDRLVLSARRAVSQAARAITDLVEPEEGPAFVEIRAHASDLAAAVALDTIAPLADYEPQTTLTRHVDPSGARLMRLSLPAIVDPSEAGRMARAMLADSRLSARRIRFAADPRLIELEPGDVVTLPGRIDGRFRILRIEDGPSRRIEAVASGEGDLAGDGGHARPPRRRRKAGERFRPVVTLVDLTPFRDGERPDFLVVAASGARFRPLLIEVSVDGGTWRKRGQIALPATLGRLTAPLSPGNPAFIDRAGVLDVRLVRGAFSSVTTAAMLGGENRLAVIGPDGSFEVLGFETAEETAPRQFRLTGLNRGLSGTSSVAAIGLPAGSRVLLLDEAVVPVGLKASELGRTVNVRLVDRRNPAEPIGPFAVTGGAGYDTPYAPVHLVARRLANGDCMIGFRRTGRFGADPWEPADIPLDEPVEAYRIEIREGTVIRRMFEANTPGVVYSAAEQIADFGALPAGFTLAVAQKGDRVIFGQWSVTTVHF